MLCINVGLGQADVLRDSDLDAAISQSLDEAAASPQKATAKTFLDSIRRQDSHVGKLEIEKQVHPDIYCSYLSLPLRGAPGQQYEM